MIDMILPFIKESAARAVPPYQTFLKAQNVFVRKKFIQFQSSKGHESNGIKLLRYILQQVDYSYMDRLVNNYERYSYHVKLIHQDISSIINPATHGKGYYDKFITKQNSVTEEFIIPLQDINNITHLPLESMSWERWRRITPLRMWAHDTDEYSLNLLFDRVYFELPPTRAVITLNIVSLIFKYYIWSKTQKYKEADQDTVQKIPQQYFLHKYVLSSWVYDLTDIWLLRMINRVMNVTDKIDLEQFKSSYLIEDNQYGYVVQQSYSGLSSLHQLFTDTKRTLEPEILLSSKLLTHGSVYDRLQYTDIYQPIPNLRQYEFLKWLRDKDILTLCVNVYKLNPDNLRTKQLILNLKKDFNKKLLARPWNTIKNSVLKYEIEREMNEFRDVLLSQ